METPRFERAADAFSNLEKKAMAEGKFQPSSDWEFYRSTLVIALARLSSLGERLRWFSINRHKLIDYELFKKARDYLTNYELQGKRKKQRYAKGTYDALAEVCIAAKELYDNEVPHVVL